MIVWTPAALGVLYACVLYFCICTCSAQVSLFHMERRSRNTLIIIIIWVTFGVLFGLVSQMNLMLIQSCPINIQRRRPVSVHRLKKERRKRMMCAWIFVD